MGFVSELWLPILLSAVFVFIMSSLIHMVFKWHANEFKGAPNQDALQNAIRGAAPGLYAFPFVDDPKERMSPENMKKWADGPSAWMTIIPTGGMNMGRMLTQWFVFNVIVSFFTAYVAFHSLPITVGPTPYLAVFRVVGTIGFMAYGFAFIGDTIWFGRPWKSLMLSLLDALLYGLMMAGAFGWLWPETA
jgi:hypothetical protein